MRCAYLILAHRYPDQLARLAAALVLPDAARETGDKAYIHIDRRIDLELYEDALHRAGMRRDHHYVFVERREITAWGDFSLVQATLNLIEACLSDADNEKQFGYLSLLSGQDYPLVGIPQLKRHLALKPDAEHISYFTLPHDGWAMNGGLDRVRKFHNPGLRERIRTSGIPGGRYLGAALALALLKVPRLGGVPGGGTIYGGWQWWTLTSSCARFVLDYAERNPKFVHFFRSTFIPDELFFQTVILNSPLASQVSGNYRRYIEWDGIKPRVFTLDDLPQLTSASGQFLFARKFAMETPADIELLNRLDQYRAGGLAQELPWPATLESIA